MKTIDDALELRGRIFGAFEMAELERDPETRQRVAHLRGRRRRPDRRRDRRPDRGAVQARARGRLPGDRSRQRSRAAVRRRQGGARRVRRPPLGQGARRGSSAWGSRSTSRASSPTSIAPGSSVRSGGRGASHRGGTKVWAAGVQASPLARTARRRPGRRACDRAGRIKVRPDCTLPGHPEVFAIGDMMALDGPARRRRGGDAAGHPRLQHDQAPAEGRRAKPFHYRDLGQHGDDLPLQGGRQLQGDPPLRVPGWLVWLFVHLAFLTGFKNRFATVLHWAVTFIGNSRPQRTITAQQVIGRVAIDQAGGRPFLLSLTSDDEPDRPEGETTE